MPKLSDEQKQKYLSICGVRCPYCGSEDIRGEAVEINEGEAAQDVNQFEFFMERNILKPSQVAAIAMINHIKNPGSILCLCGHSTIIARMAVHTHNAAPVDAIAQNQSSIVLPRERFIRAVPSLPHHVSSTISSSDQM